ncbi:conserved hypothetical protein [Vibrio phage 501E54-1]|nr:conserved hypothetical protein [Vibrio phage 501E54-1]
MRDEFYGLEIICEKGIKKILKGVARVTRGVKTYNMQCESCSPLKDIFPEGFSIPKGQFLLKSFPCLCGKAPKLTEDQWIKVYNLKYSKGKFTFLETNGKLGSKKKIVFKCNICSLDKEMYGEGIFEAKSSHIKDGIISCGCSKSYRPSHKQKKLKAQRVAKAKGFILENFDNKNVVTFKNKLTGHIWKVPYNYISVDKHTNDPSLTSLKRSKSLEQTEETHIQQFLATGSYPLGTKFIRTAKRTSSINKSKYWEVTCGDCKESYYKTLANLKRGQLGCSCSPFGGYSKQKLGRFYIVRWEGYGESYIKFGITNREVLQRISEQDTASSHLDYTILHEFYHEDGNVAADCEKYLMSVMETGVCTKELLPDGYTETCHDTQQNIDLILSQVNKFGLKYKENNNEY